ncbi:uncharacterized protein LOC116304361 [Actinia tenebrosa]|uniref:Uncharacterized protein LOC116304361 n=1 Tax=Actinia tenebrosa TaxID=6105 RepID=A0A6P8ISR0_ACTTE|nr:uncharacterized protein LOC116304361 [Actinia tenebrosa]
MLKYYFAFFWLLLCYKSVAKTEIRSGYYQKLQEDKQNFIILARTKQLDDFACVLACTHAKLAECKGVIYSAQDGSCFVKFDEREIGTILPEDIILYKGEPKGWFHKKIF